MISGKLFEASAGSGFVTLWAATLGLGARWVRSDENGPVREAHELIALALALEDEGRPDEDVVAALVAAAEGHILRLQSAYASTLYLTHELPFDQRAHDLSAMFLTALKYVAAHEPVDGRGGSADTEWLRRGRDREQRGVLADRLAIATGDREAVLRNARQLQADLDRLRRERKWQALGARDVPGTCETGPEQ